MKWWFSDYDGTINLEHNDHIDKRDVNFIKKWISDGNVFTVATGRMYHEIAPVLAKNNIPCDYMICNNGAIAYESENKILYHSTIPFEVRTGLLDIMTKLRNNYILGYCVLDERRHYSYAPTKEIDGNEFFESLPRVNNFEIGDKDILTNPDLNLVYVFLNERDVLEVKEMFKNLVGCKIVNTHKNVLEIMNKEVSKAHGIKQIQKIQKFKDDVIIASGDGENDIEMLDLAAKSFAMSQHQPKVDKFADAIITNVYEIEKYL